MQHTRLPGKSGAIPVRGADTSLQTGEHGCAAALHRADGRFPADTMADAAQTQYDPGRFGAALFDGQALRLERSGLSNWRLVFQSIRMAISVHVRGLVCAWWIGTGDAIHSIAYRVGAWHRLSSVRSGDDYGGPVRRTAVTDPTGDLRRLQSERQNQPRALSLAALCCVRLLCRSSAATRLAGAGMADLSARNQMRSAVARSLLHRHIPVLCCTFRVGRDFRRYLDADRGQHCRHPDDDRAGVLPVLVEECRQSTDEDQADCRSGRLRGGNPLPQPEKGKSRSTDVEGHNGGAGVAA